MSGRRGFCVDSDTTLASFRLSLPHRRGL